LTTNPAGHGKRNNAVNSYVEAARIMNDPFTVNTNILAIPGIRDPLVTDRVGEFAQDYGKQVYLMDVPAYDQDSVRLFAGAADQSGKRPDAEKTADKFDSRGIDNSYVAAYFPDVRLHDDVNDRVVRAPASTVALGALGFNDKVAYPWFAPAGFNRGSLTAVRNVDVRLSSGDRNTLYDARINPIASFPNEGFVIFGQKTLQIAQSALDRVNVRRMLLEVKRLVLRAANQLVFEQNTPATRQRFVGQVRPLLSVVQAQAGIESFDVVMDETNNTQADVESNRLNGRIVVKPTRSIEYIAIDFVITNSGVIF